MKLAQTLVMELVEEVEEVVEVEYPTTFVRIFPEFDNSYYKFLRRRHGDDVAEEYEAYCCKPCALAVIPPLFYGFSAITN